MGLDGACCSRFPS